MRLLLLLLLTLTLTLSARVITDDYGREVEVPQNITKIYAASPPMSMSLLAFDRELLAALNSPFLPKQEAYVGSAYKKPIAGGFFGGGKSVNFEVLAAIKPDVAIAWGGMSGVEKLVKKLELLGIPVLLLKNESIKDLVTQFKFYGELTQNKKRADELMAYTQETLRLVDSVQEKLSKNPPKRYYFAEGLEGLSSECEGSFHLEPFLYAGAKNALDCKMSSQYGMEKISAEQVVMSDPDVIIVMEKEFYKNIQNNPRFSSLRAVKTGEVYLVPSEPFNYITRPPSFMRLMGIRWLIHTLYPEILPNTQDEELRNFQKIFFSIS